ncbi:GlsB/YeaQ/YmgE family stress response membrane protein [Nocardioides sp. MH1]|uniref:GlsB/YeaQ/YmgE family stress response membrane protein n=1 Tax=Nocardioides sp. MH1 TaxID=3242490 RepID=UPI0035207E2A
MALIGFLVFGLVVGVLARLLKPGRQHLGIAGTLLLGVIGSVIGGVIASALGTGDIWELNFLGAVVAVIAAVLLIGVVEAVMGKNDHGRRHALQR